MKKRILALTLAAMLLLGMASCVTPSPAIDTDRDGNPIVLPASIDKVISLGPSNTEILVALGCADKIIAVDTYSVNVDGIPDNIPLFPDLTQIDCEQLIVLEPDVIFATGMVQVESDNPLKPISDVGICVIYIPSSDSIKGIYDDIRFIASVMGEKKSGDKIVSDMEKEIKAIKAIGDKITNKKTVYFDIGFPYSLGSGTFINEMIEIIGAVNIFADQNSWIRIADEAVLDANPDVILTCVYWAPISDITGRPGWDVISAVKNGDVYYIENDSSNRPSQNIIKALKEMAQAVYPDKF